jgi:hypothetical protein
VISDPGSSALPSPDPAGPLPALRASDKGAVVKPGPGGSSTIISILSSSDRSGHWRVAPRLKVISVLGGSDIDLTEADLSVQPPPPGAPVIHLRMLSVMGGGDVKQGRKLTKAERRLKKSRERGELDGG